MSYGRGSGGEISETFQNILDGAGKFVAWLGALASLLSIGFLVFQCVKYGGGASDNIQMAHSVIDVLSRVLLAGLIALGVGTTYLFWGSEVLAVLQLALAAALFFSPQYLPGMVGAGNGPGTDVVSSALNALESGGIWFGLLAICVLLSDVFARVGTRTKTGVKADQLKYGKGVKEEAGKKNVFLGKCWQLPFCRQFVRERCPIYHAKTTCWKEMVGCMCEESVIRNAMENKPIPKDALLAAKMIPHNNRLTVPQKKERCRNCVIYNEHQRHKYKATMPAVTGMFILVYAGLHAPLIAMMNAVVMSINKVVQHGMANNNPDTWKAPTFFVETMLFVFFLVGLSYAMKTIEFLIFKAKI